MLELIDLDIDSLGYKKFISSWVYKGREGTFLVDTGPACTFETLAAELERLEVDRLDYILLTHIHLDHAGGAGHLAERFPEAKLVCHEKAVKHLVSPERLWEGSVKVIGDIAEAYGPPRPVSADRIITARNLDFGDGLKVVSAPGHAAHHQCFVFKDLLFAGELFGVFHEFEDAVYMRPATPPRFILEEFRASMDRMAPYVDRRICFAHYGSYFDGRKILEMARKQLPLWVDVIGRHADDRPDMDAIIADLVAEDRVFARFSNLPEDIYPREYYYATNTIRGILEYIRSSSQS